MLYGDCNYLTTTYRHLGFFFTMTLFNYLFIYLFCALHSRIRRLKHDSSILIRYNEHGGVYTVYK